MQKYFPKILNYTFHNDCYIWIEQQLICTVVFGGSQYVILSIVKVNIEIMSYNNVL